MIQFEIKTIAIAVVCVILVIWWLKSLKRFANLDIPFPCAQANASLKPQLDTKMRARAKKGDLDAMVEWGKELLQHGDEAHQQAEGFQFLKRAADRGHARATTELGICYDNGQGVKQNFETACKLFERAAELGDLNAFSRLAEMYMNGWGVAQCAVTAVELYRRAADLGDPLATFNMGTVHLAGVGGVKQSAKLGAAYYHRSAELGFDDGMCAYGNCLANGNGVAKNPREACVWFLRAAQANNAAAMERLATQLFKGDGVRQDARKALAWLCSSAERGCAAGMFGLALLLDKMDASYKPQAVYYYRRATAQGHTEAVKRLFLCLYNGDGDDIEINDAQAHEWLVRLRTGLIKE